MLELVCEFCGTRTPETKLPYGWGRVEVNKWKRVDNSTRYEAVYDLCPRCLDKVLELGKCPRKDRVE